MLEGVIVQNDEQIAEIIRESNRIKKTIRRRRQKDLEHRKHSSSVNELKKRKTGIRKKINALRQTCLHIEKVTDQVKLNNKDKKRKILNLPCENPFDFTE